MIKYKSTKKYCIGGCISLDICFYLFFVFHSLLHFDSYVLFVHYHNSIRRFLLSGLLFFEGYFRDCFFKCSSVIGAIDIFVVICESDIRAKSGDNRSCDELSGTVRDQRIPMRIFFITKKGRE